MMLCAEAARAARVGRHPPDRGADRCPAPGPHGGDARLAAWLDRPVEEVLDLSASLNPVAPDVTVVAGKRSARSAGTRIRSRPPAYSPRQWVSTRRWWC